MKILGAGRVLLLAEPPHNKPHLWFVLTDPAGTPPRVVAVMLRTATKFTDTTLTLDVGDHPFIRHQSSVHYSTAHEFVVSGMNTAMASGRCKLREDMSPDLLDRVRRGLLQSPFTVHVVRDLCRPLFGEDDAN